MITYVLLAVGVMLLLAVLAASGLFRSPTSTRRVVRRPARRVVEEPVVEERVEREL